MTDLADGIQKFHDQAAGLLCLHVVCPADIPDLLLQALAGDRLAGHMLRAVMEKTRRIETAPRHRRVLCASCPRGLRRGEYSVVAAFPYCDNPSRVIAMAVCSRCGTEPNAIVEKARLGLQGIWPGLRKVSITHPDGGTA